MWRPLKYAEWEETYYDGERTARESNEWQGEQITVRRLKRPIGFRPQKAKKRKGRRK